MNDRYVKGVLTVIAGALVWIAVQLSLGAAQAAPSRGPAAMWTRQEIASNRDDGGTLVVPVYCVNCK